MKTLLVYESMFNVVITALIRPRVNEVEIVKEAI